MEVFVTNNTPALSVTGVSKGHAKRAISWMRNRNLLAFYRQEDHTLNAFEFKGGRDFTYKALNDALEATR